MSLSIQQPTNDAEFEAMMRAVDEHLRARNLEPFQRPLHAFLEVSRTLQLGLRMPTPKRDPFPGCYTGDDMTIRVFRWYNNNYGSKLRTFFGPGRIVVMIRGEPWVATLPFVMGSVRFIIDPSAPVASNGTQLGVREVPVANMLDSFRELPAAVRTSLTSTEQRAIADTYIAGFRLLSKLLEKYSVGMCKEVRSDLETSVDQLVARSPHYGQSLWASLQAAEKMLKTFIAERGGAFKRAHNLKELVQTAVPLGLSPLDPAWIPAIQCSAGVRYGEEKVDLLRAHAGHWSAVCLVGTVASQL